MRELRCIAFYLSVALGLIALFTAGARAQVSLSGMVDVAHKRDIRQKPARETLRSTRRSRGAVRSTW